MRTLEAILYAHMNLPVAHLQPKSTAPCERFGFVDLF
jgi:hypothetical protein